MVDEQRQGKKPKQKKMADEQKQGKKPQQRKDTQKSRDQEPPQQPKAQKPSPKQAKKAKSPQKVLSVGSAIYDEDIDPYAVGYDVEEVGTSTYSKCS